MKKTSPVRSPLSDEQWSEIQHISRLPHDARAGIAEIIQFFRNRPQRVHPRVGAALNASEALRIAKRELASAVSVINQLIETRAYTYLRRPLGPPSNVSHAIMTRDELARVRNQLAEITRLIVSVAPPRRLETPRRKDHLSDGVRDLHHLVLHFTGVQMNTAKRPANGIDWVKFVSKVVDL